MPATHLLPSPAHVAQRFIDVVVDPRETFTEAWLLMTQELRETSVRSICSLPGASNTLDVVRWGVEGLVTAAASLETDIDKEFGWIVDRLRSEWNRRYFGSSRAWAVVSDEEGTSSAYWIEAFPLTTPSQEESKHRLRLLMVDSVPGWCVGAMKVPEA